MKSINILRSSPLQWVLWRVKGFVSWLGAAVPALLTLGGPVKKTRYAAARTLCGGRRAGLVAKKAAVRPEPPPFRRESAALTSACFSRRMPG